MSTIERWEKRFARERQARQQAERILEARSRELYAANQALEKSKAELELRVEERTAALQNAIEQLKFEATRRIEVQEELRHARDLAIESADVKTEFLARMSHEIRTPLNAVIGLTNVLLDSEINAVQRTQLRTVRTSGQMLLRIINDILDMSKIDAGKLEIEYASVDLLTVMQQAFSLFLIDASNKDIELHQTHQALLPTRLVIDGGRVQQILTNLLSNAVKYSDGGVVTAGLKVKPIEDRHVSAALRRDHPEAAGYWQELELSVTDQGRGIPQEQLKRLFDPFTRVDFAEDLNGASSSGLGLAICRHLAQSMGGEISVVSELGVGTTFTVKLAAWLPDDQGFIDSDQYRVSATSDINQTRVEMLASRENQPHLQRYLSMAQDKPLTVLLADDYDVNRMVLQTQLESLGYRADAVSNGEEVLRALHARAYDVVLMDIRMPIIDGMEATRRIRSQKQAHQPFIVAVTASALKGDREAYLATGMDGYLAKPVDIVELGQVLEAAFEASGKATSPSLQSTEDPIAQSATLQLDALRQRLGPGLNTMLKKVIPVYLRELPGRLDHLDRALTESDATAFARYCHGLKGTSKSVGAVELAERCGRYEEAGYRDQLPSELEFSELAVLAEETAQALRETLKDI